MKKEIISSALIAFFVLLINTYIAATDQSAKPAPAKWQVATIMDVRTHPLTAGEDPAVIRYDVTVRVGNMEYVVLYTPPDPSYKAAVKYQLGIDHLVLVGSETMKYNDMLGRTYEVPIISRRTIAVKSPPGDLKSPTR